MALCRAIYLLFVLLFTGLPFVQPQDTDHYLHYISQNSVLRQFYFPHHNQTIHLIDLVLNDEQRSTGAACDSSLSHLRNGLINFEDWAVKCREMQNVLLMQISESFMTLASPRLLELVNQLTKLILLHTSSLRGERQTEERQTVRLQRRSRRLRPVSVHSDRAARTGATVPRTVLPGLAANRGDRVDQEAAHLPQEQRWPQRVISIHH